MIGISTSVWATTSSDGQQRVKVGWLWRCVFCSIIGLPVAALWDFVLTSGGLAERLKSAFHFNWQGALGIVVVWAALSAIATLFKRNILFAGCLVLVLFQPFGLLFSVLHLLVTTGEIPSYAANALSSPMYWLPFTGLDESLLVRLVDMAIIVSLVTVGKRTGQSELTSAPRSDPATNWRPWKMSEPMARERTETTRYLCAAAILNGRGFRRTVIKHFQEEGRGAAPELGLDADLLLRMCLKMEKRYIGYCAAFLVMGIIAAVVGVLTNWLLLGLAICIITALHVQMSWSERSLAKKYFARGGFDPAIVREEFIKNQEISPNAVLPADDQNLVTYKGFIPFIGVGTPIDGLTFVVDLSRSNEKSVQPKSFDLSVLVEEIWEKLIRANLPCMELRRVYFVQGCELHTWDGLLPDIYGCPVQHLPEGIGQQISKNNSLNLREYQWASVADWGRELIVSYFLRCSLEGNVLFVENDRYVLSPLSSEYRSVDRLREPSFVNFMKSVGLSVAGGLISVVGSLLVFTENSFEAFVALTGRRKRAFRQRVDEDRFYNYGADRSIRETMAGRWYTHYFQKKDGEYFQQTLLKIVIDSIVEFLDRHDIDTSELREGRTTVLNSGIIVHGGDVKAESLAVGSGAESRSTRIESAKVSRTKKASSKE
jgi:hypothetical protein